MPDRFHEDYTQAEMFAISKLALFRDPNQKVRDQVSTVQDTLGRTRMVKIDSKELASLRHIIPERLKLLTLTEKPILSPDGGADDVFQIQLEERELEVPVIGSLVDVYSSSDGRWYTGKVTNEDGRGLIVVEYTNAAGQPKKKPVQRGDET